QSQDVMFMNPRQFLSHVQRNEQPPHPPNYPPAQPQLPTGVPVIAINSFSEAQMTPEQVDQVQRDFFGEQEAKAEEEDSFSSAFSGRPRRDFFQQD
ncbi:MAG: hypothetical protein ACKPKO_46370, partial [Candidatus Fonsibacter sp.]